MSQYDKIAKEYRDKRGRDGFDFNLHIELPAMMKMLGDVKGKAVLDLGCGFGDHLSILSKKGIRKGVGLDNSKKLLASANERNIRNCQFIMHDLNKKLPFKSDSFDVVFSSLSIHYVNEISLMFGEVNRVLKKRGIFVFSTAHPIMNMYSMNTGISPIKFNEKKIFSWNYFDESLAPYSLGFAKVRLYPRTFETLIKLCVTHGFEIVDYKDARPILSSKKFGSRYYSLSNKIPTFIFFKLKKK